METKNPLSDDIRVHHGHNLRYFREKQNMELAELAKKVKISQEEIQKLEEMQRIDDETLKKMGDALDVSVDAIKLLKEEKAPAVVQNNNNVYNNDNNQDSIFELGNNCVSGNVTNYKESLSLFKHLAKSYEMMLKLERERNDKLQAILDKLMGQTDGKDNPSPKE